MAIQFGSDEIEQIQQELPPGLFNYAFNVSSPVGHNYRHREESQLNNREKP
jgi:hypothetical protein